MFHLNIRNFLPKTDLIRAWTAQYKPDVFTFSETWLHSEICDHDIQLNNYILYRSYTRGGGVALYVSSRLISEPAIPKVSPSFLECLFVRLKLHENKHLIVGSVYPPPPVRPDLTKCRLSTLTSFEHPCEMVLLGHFYRNRHGHSLSDDKNLLQSINLTQLINEPTRVQASSKSLLDWILDNHPDRILTSGVLSDRFSHHSAFFCVWKIKSPSRPSCQTMQELQFWLFQMWFDCNKLGQVSTYTSCWRCLELFSLWSHKSHR